MGGKTQEWRDIFMSHRLEIDSFLIKILITTILIQREIAYDEYGYWIE